MQPFFKATSVVATFKCMYSIIIITLCYRLKKWIGNKFNHKKKDKDKRNLISWKGKTKWKQTWFQTKFKTPSQWLWLSESSSEHSWISSYKNNQTFTWCLYWLFSLSCNCKLITIFSYKLSLSSFCDSQKIIKGGKKTNLKKSRLLTSYNS